MMLRCIAAQLCHTHALQPTTEVFHTSEFSFILFAQPSRLLHHEEQHKDSKKLVAVLHQSRFRNSGYGLQVNQSTVGLGRSGK